MKAKRWHSPQAKPGELIARWGRVDRYDPKPTLVYAWGAHGASKPDSRCLMAALEEADILDGKSLRAVLEERGYDITTLRFSICQKAAPPSSPDEPKE